MKIKTWIIWICLLVVPGSAGFLTVFVQQTLQAQKMSQSRLVHKDEAKEFLAMYDRWSRLSEEEKLENPWGQGPYGGPEIQQRLRANQDQRLLANLPELLSGVDLPEEAAEILFGSNWREKVNAYRGRLEVQEIVATASTLLLVCGGIVTVIFAGRFSFLLLRSHRVRRQRKAALKTEETDTEADDTTKTTATQDADMEETLQSPPEPEKAKEKQPTMAQTLGYFEIPRNAKPTPISSGSDNSGGGVETKISQINQASMALLEETKAAADPALQNLMTPEPVAKELNELTEQMSAIRQFAAEQQTHIRKLQDGYDWMLIKRFCLRIIRCIDNLEDRLGLMRSDGEDTSAMEDIRDELIFALESSGVEAFEPETGREYRGLEKYAEAVKDRMDNEDPARSGTIAEIVRPGYHYLISEDDVKIVRCAQVKLYS